jgi:hypothetical protein
MDAERQGEQFRATVPHGFRASLRRLVGDRMRRTGDRITEGQLLNELVRKALAEVAR